MGDENILSSIFSNKVSMPDGLEYVGDLKEVVGVVDLLASEYGLGGCRSIEEYFKMVDEMDPLLINFFIEAIGERYKAMYGDDEGEDNGNDINEVIKNRSSFGESNRKFKKQKKETVSVGESKDPKFNRMKMANFLKVMGADKAEVNEAIKKIESGEIKVSDNDYSWINSKTLRDKDFDLKGTMKKMREDYEKSANFKVSLETMLGMK